ncbi:hypothetical protein Dimus_000450, partial [Dionaea muscipula]
SWIGQDPCMTGQLHPRECTTGQPHTREGLTCQASIRPVMDRPAMTKVAHDREALSKTIRDRAASPWVERGQPRGYVDRPSFRRVALSLLHTSTMYLDPLQDRALCKTALSARSHSLQDRALSKTTLSA